MLQYLFIPAGGVRWGGRAAGEDLYRARSDPTHPTCCNGVYSYWGRSDPTHRFGHESEIVFLCI
jgi:hypothetical protein